MDAEHGNDAEDVKLRFHGESEALARVLRHNLQLLRDTSEPHVRGEALVAIASHLDLTREAKTREELLHTLRARLWKEEDLFLVQSLVKVLVDVALVPMLAASPAQSVDCVGSLENVESARDGVVSNTSSPLKRKADERREDKGGCEGERFSIASSVAQVLQGFLVAKDQVELGLRSAVRLQLLHSLVKIGETTDGVVTWESLGFVVRRHLRSSNPRVRALVLRLLVESVQERNSENAVEVEAENAKRRRGGEAPLSLSVQGSMDLEMKAVDDPQGLLAKSDDNETNQQVVSGDSPGFGRSGSKVEEILLSSLVNYMRDPFPFVRETAVRALMKLHAKGYELTSECCKNATNLFRDSFEHVRITAIEMVSSVSPSL